MSRAEIGLAVIVSGALLTAHEWGHAELVEGLAVALVTTGLIAVPFLTLTHELGHAVAAILLTRRAVVVQLGKEPSFVHFSIGRLTLRLSPTGHRARCDIASPSPPLTRLAIIALAGPATSFAIASLLAWLAIALPADQGSEYFWFFSLAASVSLVLAVTNLDPRRPPACRSVDGPTDGALVLRALTSRGR